MTEPETPEYREALEEFETVFGNEWWFAMWDRPGVLGITMGPMEQTDDVVTAELPMPTTAAAVLKAGMEAARQAQREGYYGRPGWPQILNGTSTSPSAR